MQNYYTRQYLPKECLASIDYLILAISDFEPRTMDIFCMLFLDSTGNILSTVNAHWTKYSEDAKYGVPNDSDTLLSGLLDSLSCSDDLACISIYPETVLHALSWEIGSTQVRRLTSLVQSSHCCLMHLFYLPFYPISSRLLAIDCYQSCVFSSFGTNPSPCRFVGTQQCLSALVLLIGRSWTRRCSVPKKWTLCLMQLRPDLSV